MSAFTSSAVVPVFALAKAALARMKASLALSNASPGLLLIVIVFVIVSVLIVILLPAIKDNVSEPLVANITEVLEMIVSKENWLLM